MDGIPLLLLFLIAASLIGTYAVTQHLVWQFVVFGLLLVFAMAALPDGSAQLIPWAVYFAAAARAGRLLVIAQQQEATR